MTNDTQTIPEPLDPSRLHSPTEVRIHAAKVAAFRDAVREEEAAQRRRQEATEAASDAPLDENGYFELAINRHNEQQAKKAAREAAEQAECDAAIAYLASSPDRAEAMANDPSTLLKKLEPWFARGYRLTADSIKFWMPNLMHVVLAAPVSAKGGNK
jgi:hypothetical protein